MFVIPFIASQDPLFDWQGLLVFICISGLKFAIALLFLIVITIILEVLFKKYDLVIKDKLWNFYVEHFRDFEDDYQGFCKGDKIILTYKIPDRDDEDKLYTVHTTICDFTYQDKRIWKILDEDGGSWKVKDGYKVIVKIEAAPPRKNYLPGWL